MERRLASRVAGLVAIALVAVACASTGPKTTPATGPPGSGRIARLRVAAGPGGYPSPIGPKRIGVIQATLVFDTLVWKDSTGNVIPWLASSWERSSDGTTWTFTLHDGVRWQDGQPLTADDVVFTYNYLMRGPAQVPAGIFGQVFIQNFVDVTSPAPNKVVFQMKRPWATFLPGIVGLVLILPKHIWENVTDPAKFTGPQAVMGSGPYRLESYDEATTAAAFVANDDYFLGPPQVKRIEFVPVADELQALQRGDIDAANAGTEDQLPEQALAPFEDKKYASITGKEDWNRALHFNLARGFPYNDKRFRQAVAYAIDRIDMVKRILFGRGVPGSAGSLAPSSPWAAPGLPTYDHDPARARALLLEALDQLRGTDAAMLEAEVLQDLARVDERLDQGGAAREALLRAAEIHRRKGNVVRAAEVEALLAGVMALERYRSA
jgi:peptide/nickel transport system substrate-binding protein